MFHYKRFAVNPIEENCYIIWDDTSHEGAIIDCGTWSNAENTTISRFLHDNGITLKYSLQTHMHFDHCLGLGFIAGQYGLTPLCHQAELPIYHGAPEMVQKWFRIDISSSLPPVSGTLTESTPLNLGSFGIQVLHTPGHTPGGLCYHIPQAQIVLTGDTLFNQGIGRTDLPGGDYDVLMRSIFEKLLMLDGETRILPGHGPSSDISTERMTNPFLLPFNEPVED